LSHARHDDGDSRGRRLRDQGGRGCLRHDHINGKGDRLRRQRREALRLIFSPAGFDDDVSAIDPAELGESFTNKVERLLRIGP